MKKRCLVLLFLILSNVSFGQNSAAKIKTIFIYSFTKYVTWPEDGAKTEFRIGVLGDEPEMASELHKLSESKSANGVPIRIATFNSTSEIKPVDILYVDVKKTPVDLTLLNKHLTFPALLITENNPDIEQTMIAFFEDGQKQRFALNKKRLIEKGLTVSPRLEALASTIINGNNSTEDTKKVQEWKSVFTKFNEIVAGKGKEIVISKAEAAEVIQTMNAKDQEIAKQIKDLDKGKQDLEIQKNMIDQQLLSINNLSKRTELQEERLKISIEQNKLQQLELMTKQKEFDLQQNKIKAQRQTLADQQESIDIQKKNIDLQNEKLIAQLNRINSQKLILALFGIVILLVAIGMSFMIYSYRQKQRINKELSLQKLEIERSYEMIKEKNMEILDSITYAERLQKAILAEPSVIKEYFPDHFLFYRPKDIVAGDFYFFEVTPDFIFIAAADCTGHGVPGALVSMVCSNCLNQALNEFNCTDPGLILSKTTELILHTFRKGSQEIKDGMDISFLSVNRRNGEMKWAGANNPLWYLEDGEMIKIAPNKQPVGLHDRPVPFQTHTIHGIKDRTVFLFTDGFADQFGGPKGKKFKYKQLEEILIQYSCLPMEEQKQNLESALLSWKGNLEQVDDILLIGIKFTGAV